MCAMAQGYLSADCCNQFALTGGTTVFISRPLEKVCHCLLAKQWCGQTATKTLLDKQAVAHRENGLPCRQSASSETRTETRITASAIDPIPPMTMPNTARPVHIAWQS